MAREKAPTWQRERVILPTGGPEAVGILPDAAAGPTRPVNRRAPAGTNAHEIPRPAQGEWKGQDLGIPSPTPWGR